MGAKTKQDFDTVYEMTGAFGNYQLWLFVMASAAGLMAVDVMYLNFVSFNMDHWCTVDELKHLPFDLQKEIAIPKESISGTSDETYSSCNRFDLDYNLTNEQFLNWNRTLYENTETVSCDSWTYDQSEYSYSAVNRFSLVCGKAWQSDFISTVNMLGILFGSITFGLLADRIGRKWSVLGAVGVKSVGGLISAFAPYWSVLLVGRFINGFGSVATYDITVMYLMEKVGPQYRSWTGEIFAVVYSIGFMLVPAYAFAIRDYSYLQVVMSAPSLIVAIMYIFFLPESPRWLLVTGKTKQADDIVKTMADVNGKELPQDFTLADFHVKSDSNEKQASFLELMRNAKLRKRALISFVLWFSNALLYYAYSLNAGNLSGNTFLNTFLLAAVEIPANILCLVMMNQPFLGRRLTNCFALMLAGISGVISIPLIVTGVSPTAVTALAMVGKLGSTMGFNGMYIYTSEIFPTEVRAAGLGASSMCARIAGLIGPYVGGLLVDYWAPAMSTVAGVLGIVTGLFTLMLPETLGRNLDDTVNQVDAQSETKDGTVNSDFKLEQIKIQGLNHSDAQKDNQEDYDIKYIDKDIQGITKIKL